jgi:hypothetical protein
MTIRPVGPASHAAARHPRDSSVHWVLPTLALNTESATDQFRRRWSSAHRTIIHTLRLRRFVRVRAPARRAKSRASDSPPRKPR